MTGGANGKLRARAIAITRRILSYLPAAIPLLLGCWMIQSPTASLEHWRDLVFDEYQAWSPRAWSPDLPVRIIGIDDPALAVAGQWPWPRARMAELTNKLVALGPAAIGFDIVFSEEDRLEPSVIVKQLPDIPERAPLAQKLKEMSAQEGDKLAQAIANAPVVLAETFINDGGAPEAARVKSGVAAIGDDPTGLVPYFKRSLPPLPALLEAAPGLGSVNFIPDRDLIVRKAPLIFAVGPTDAPVLAPSLVLELLRLAQIDHDDPDSKGPSPMVKSTGSQSEYRMGGDAAVTSTRIGDFEIPVEKDGQVRVRFAGHQDGRFISAADIFNETTPREAIEGRILLVGVTAASLGDIRSTPINGAIPGVEVHAELIEHIAMQARLTRLDYARGVEMVFALLGGIAAAWIAWRMRPSHSGLAILLLAIGAGGVSWYAFRVHALLFDPLLPAATWLATWGSTTVAAYRRTESERRFVRGAFSRYMAPAVVEQLANNPESLKLGGEARDVTILFSDARNFTARSETLSAEGVVHFLNTLLTPLTTAVLEHKGAVDKYMGDGMMAFWNAPVDVPDHASLACRAALQMMRTIPSVDATMMEYSLAHNAPYVPVMIGVGINTGRAFVGNMGSDQRFDYSLVGDPVNMASRLESATKDFGVPIIVSEHTKAQAKGFRFVPLGKAALKGRQSELVYALHGAADEPDPGFDAFLRVHEAALAAGEKGDELRDLLTELRQFEQSRRYARIYRRLESRAGLVEPEDSKFSLE